jgi:hypothetical protein
MHHDDAVLFELVDMFLRLVAGCLDNLDAALDDGLAVFGIRRRLDRGQDGEIHAKRLVSHAATARNLSRKVFRRRLRQRGDKPERPGISDGRHQLGAAALVVPTYSGRTASTADFEALAEEVSGEELTPLFDAWLRAPEMPSLDDWLD